MQLVGSKKINIEAVLKLIILIGFALFFYYIIQTGKVLLYVNPRIVPYVKFGIVAMILLSLFIVPDIFKPKRKPNIIPYVFFIIPLFMSFIFPAKSLDATSMAFGNINSTQQIINTTQSNVLNSNATTDSNTGITANTDSTSDKVDWGLQVQGDTIVMNDSNFVKWIQEISDNMGKYEGKKIELTGFVFKDKSFKANEFVPARFMMACCTADLQPVGFLSRYDRAAELKQDTWIKMTGKIEIVNYKGEKTPIIVAENIQKTAKPKSDYVYPY